MRVVTRYLRARFVLVTTVTLAVVIGSVVTGALELFGVVLGRGVGLTIGFGLAVGVGFTAVAALAFVRSSE